MSNLGLVPRFRNVAAGERAVRLAVGAAILLGGWAVAHGGVAMALRLLAIYPLVTAVLGWCPLKALRLRSSRRDHP